MVCYKCHITQMLLCELDEVSQLLNEIGALLYKASQLLHKVGQQIVAESYHGVWQAGQKSIPSVRKYNKPLIFHPYNQL